MKTKPLPNDLAGLVAIAEAVAAVLAERQAELGISTELEALLRASIAATTYAADSVCSRPLGGQEIPGGSSIRG